MHGLDGAEAGREEPLAEVARDGRGRVHPPELHVARPEGLDDATDQGVRIDALRDVGARDAVVREMPDGRLEPDDAVLVVLGAPG